MRHASTTRVSAATSYYAVSLGAIAVRGASSRMAASLARAGGEYAVALPGATAKRPYSRFSDPQACSARSQTSAALRAHRRRSVMSVI